MLLKHPNEMFSWIWMNEEKCSSNTNTAACTYRHGQMVNSGALKKSTIVLSMGLIVFYPRCEATVRGETKDLEPEAPAHGHEIKPRADCIGIPGARHAWSNDAASVRPWTHTNGANAHGNES